MYLQAKRKQHSFDVEFSRSSYIRQAAEPCHETHCAPHICQGVHDVRTPNFL
jgi:hypothetical protein